MAELKKYKLSDIAKVDISSVDKKTNDNETPVKLCNFTDVYYNWAITKELIDGFMEASANAKEIERYTIKKGQVAFTKDSETRFDIGIPTYIADDFDDVLLGYHCALVTPDEKKVDGKYLNAFMHSAYIQKYFENSATGSGQRYTLSIETIENMPILLPSLEAQKRIGDIFSSIDRKISLNRAINRNLEALAMQLYDYWFVQFDFPDEVGKPYKSSGGKMVWNEMLKREVPEGWEVKRLGDAVGIIRGKTITEKQTTPGNVKVVAAGLDFSYYHNQSNRTANCITVSGSGENAGFVNFWREPIYASDCSTIQFEDEVDTMLCYYTLKMQEQRFYRISHKSAQPHVLPSDIAEIPMVFPDAKVKERIRGFLVDSSKKIGINTSEIERLTRQRDELLPLLMNGQVEVGN